MLATRHGRRMSYAEIYKYRQQTPAVPPRITELLSVARANLLFIPRETVAHLPCDPLLDKYLSLKSELADAITESENGTPCQMLDLAEHLFVNGTAETLVEGWVRAWIATEGEQAARRMLAAGRAAQARVAAGMPDVIAEREAADKARRKARGRTEWQEEAFV